MKLKIIESDISGKRIDDPTQMATVLIVFADGRRGTYELDVTVEEAESLARSGRKISRDKTRS